MRRDQYSDFGGRWDPKVALRWQPTREVLVRASAGRGFRAPSLPELFTARALSLADLSNQGGDAVRCPVTHLDADCAAVVPLNFGGNPDLRPVTSSQQSVGIVVQPSARWSVSVDYWRLALRDNIGSLDVDTIFQNPAAYEGRNIVRGPTDPAFPGLPGPIIGVDTYNENLGSARTSGFDIGARYRSDATAWGRFGARLYGTLVTGSTMQTSGGTDTSNLAAYFDGQVVPRWKNRSSRSHRSGRATQ